MMVVLFTGILVTTIKRTPNMVATQHQVQSLARIYKRESVLLHIAVCKHSLKSTDIKSGV